MYLSVKILLLACSLAVVLALPSSKRQTLVGGVHNLEGDELKAAENDLKTSLSKLAAGDGGIDYKLDKVNSASEQVVSGSLRKYNVVLVNSKGDKKDCNVSIWSQPWLENGIEVTIDCEGEQKVVGKHSA